MDFDYKRIPYAQKLQDLLAYYQMSVALSQALGIMGSVGLATGTDEIAILITKKEK